MRGFFVAIWDWYDAACDRGHGADHTVCAHRAQGRTFGRIRCGQKQSYFALCIEVRVVGGGDMKNLLEEPDSGKLNSLSRGLTGVGSTTFEHAATRVRCVSTRLIVGLFVGSAIQHSSTNSQVPSPNPICSALAGFVGRTPVTTWCTTSYSAHFCS